MLEGLVVKGEHILVFSLVCQIPGRETTRLFEELRITLQAGTPLSLVELKVRLGPKNAKFGVLADLPER